MKQLLPSAMQSLVDRLLAFLDQDGCTDAQFDNLAAALFELQYQCNEHYRRFCQRRGVFPAGARCRLCPSVRSRTSRSAACHRMNASACS